MWARRDPDLASLHGEAEFERMYPEKPAHHSPPFSSSSHLTRSVESLVGVPRTCATSNVSLVIETCSSIPSRSLEQAEEGKLRIFISVCVGCCCLRIAAVQPGGAQKIRTAATVKTFIISAKKYEFAPSEIRVKVGQRVRLKVHSVDETHGIKRTLYPEGSKDKTIVGLQFNRPEDNGKVEKNADQVLDFIAEKPGTYEFQCAKVCGMHHGKMKGELIVE